MHTVGEKRRRLFRGRVLGKMVLELTQDDCRRGEGGNEWQEGRGKSRGR